MGGHPGENRSALESAGVCVGFSAVQPLAQFLAGAEEGRALLAHRHRLAGAGIAAHAAGPHLDRESAEAAQFDAMAFGQGLADGVQHGGHDPLHIAVVEVRIAGGQARNQFRLDHPQAPLEPLHGQAVTDL